MCATSLLVSAAVAQSSGADQDTTTSAPLAATATPTQSESDLARDVALLGQKVDNLKGNVTYITTAASILLAVIASGGVLGIVLSFREERRTGQAFKLALENDVRTETRVAEMFQLSRNAAQLSIQGEVVSQSRASQVHDTFLSSAQRTLQLVNDTLELAREASERAAKTLEEKSRAILNSIEARCRADFGRAIRSGEFKRIVEDVTLAGTIQEIANELASVEGYLRVQDINLPDICLFVRGMDRHLKEEPRLAIQELRQASDITSDPDLRMMANYWIGYESNNIGEHGEAAEVFGRMATDDRDKQLPRTFELQRIAIESRFFELAHSFGPLSLEGDPLPDSDTPRARLIGEVRHCAQRMADLEDALIPFDAQYDGVRSLVRVTHGNILTWIAGASLEHRSGALERAVTAFGEAGGELWGPFGRYEALRSLGQPVNGADYQAIADRVMVRVSQRVEPRSKVLLFSTRLIALGRQDERTAPELEAVFGDCLSAIGRVNPTMRVYSQFRRSNVALDDLSTELRHFYEAERDRRRLAPVSERVENVRINGGQSESASDCHSGTIARKAVALARTHRCR